MPDGETYYRDWLSQHASCETCAHCRRNLFGLECRTGESVDPAGTCDEWEPFPDFAPALDAVLAESIRLDEEFYAEVTGA